MGGEAVGAASAICHSQLDSDPITLLFLVAGM